MSVKIDSLWYLYVYIINIQYIYILRTCFCFAFFFQGVQIFIFFTARTPKFRAAMKHCGQTITSASYDRVQTYHLWRNFRKALSFESYKKWDSQPECASTGEMNTSAFSGTKKWLKQLCFGRSPLKGGSFPEVHFRTISRKQLSSKNK